MVFSPAVEKLELVECDLEKPDRILPALGNASVVVCSIGASEKEVFDITGPYRIDYQATKNLINAGDRSILYLSIRVLLISLQCIDSCSVIFDVLIKQLLQKLTTSFWLLPWAQTRLDFLRHF